MKTVIFSILVFLFLTPPIFAQVPILPAVYYGTIQTSCNLSGAKLQAYINNILRGEINVVCMNNTFCKFGGPSLSEKKLIVQGTRSENNTAKIEFYIYVNNRKVKIGEDIFVSGKVKILNFTVTSDQCNTLFGTQPTQPSEEETTGGAGTPSGITGGGITPTENVTEIVIKKLEQEGIKESIQKIIPVQNITEVKVEYNTTLELKPKLEEIRVKYPKLGNITYKIKTELEKQLKKEVSVNVQPIETKVIVKLIKIKTKTGEEKYFTKIEKEVKANKVIEIVPKDLAETADNIIWIKGRVLRILEKDPVFEVAPEEYKIAYLVEGNKTEEAKETVTLTYTYETVEKPAPIKQNITNITQPTKPEAKPNVTKPTKPNVTQQQNITIQKPEKPKVNVWILIGLVIIVVVGMIVYIVKGRSAKTSK